MSLAPELVDLAEQTFFEDPALDRAFGVVMALATEVYVLRNRPWQPSSTPPPVPGRIFSGRSGAWVWWP